ncbi:MAG TPA: diguanylate cyclase [Gemmatimonadaceae bacterium]|nr:diguanylate cyclase [Gemmatimonadaceae bacterium]
MLLDQQRRLATYDAFVDTATVSVAEASAVKRPIALLVADVDHYRHLADDYGEAYAERVLRTIFDLARANLREGELVAHPGGDELVALLRASTSAARDVAERLCAAVRGHLFPETDRGPAPRVTISIGVASAPDHGLSYQVLHAAADAARVRLKTQGRDGVAVAPLPGHEVPRRALDIDRFAGRAEEFRTLVRHLDEAVAGSPRVVAILGEAGAGTATLVRRLEPEVRLRGGSLVVGRSREQRVREPYGVWASLLAALHRLPGAPSSPWRELHHLVRAVGTDSSTTTTPWGSKYRLLDEVGQYIRLVAQKRPLVLLLDEMQWADTASWDVLEHLCQQLVDERLIIALTFRTEPAYAEAAERRQALTRSAVYREITLPRLTRDEAKRWLEGAMHGQEVGRELLAFLYRHTEGNPFFIAQLLRTLVEEGALWHAEGRWQWTPVSELRLPIGLPALIARRLARLSSSTQAVLSIAAVIGGEFDVGLAVAAGAGSEAAVQLALSEGLAAGVLKPSYERGGRGYAFTHAHIVDALVQSLPQDRLRQTHQRVAEALELRDKTRVSEIALHYDAAGSSQPAYLYALIAAEHGDRVYAYAATSGFLNVAGRNASTPAELAEVRLRLATLAEVTGRFDEAEELCDLAIEWFVGKGDAKRALTLRRMRERARKELGRPPNLSLESLLQLEQEARSLGFVSERIEIMMMLSQTYGRLGDLVAAERTAKECVETAERHGDLMLLTQALTRLAVTLQTDDPDRAAEIYLRTLDIGQQTGDAAVQARTHNNLGNIAIRRNDSQRARTSYRNAIALARGAGIPDIWGVAALNLGVSHLHSGEYDRARELLGEALALVAAVKNSEIQLYALYNLAAIEWENDRWEAAAELYEASASLAARIGASDVEIGSIGAVGLCNVEAKQIDKARQASSEIQELLSRRSDWFQGREFAVALSVALLVVDGEGEQAIEEYERAVSFAEPSDLYTAAWLTANCGRTLLSLAPERMRPWIERFRSPAEEFGYAGISKRFNELMNG